MMSVDNTKLAKLYLYVFPGPEVRIKGSLMSEQWTTFGGKKSMEFKSNVLFGLDVGM